MAPHGNPPKRPGSPVASSSKRLRRDDVTLPANTVSDIAAEEYVEEATTGVQVSARLFDTVDDEHSEEQHRRWDSETLAGLTTYFPSLDVRTPAGAYLFLGRMLFVSEEMFGEDIIGPPTVQLLCDTNSELREMIADAVERRDFRHLRCLSGLHFSRQEFWMTNYIFTEIFRKQHSRNSKAVRTSSGSASNVELTSDEKKATMASWNEAFVGEADEGLHEYLINIREGSIYARIFPLANASGIGKSRTIDELSKKYVVIPLNLSIELSPYPPPDSEIRTWIEKHTQRSIRRASHDDEAISGFNPERCDKFFTAFLSALFWTTKDVVCSNIHAAINDDETLDEDERQKALTNFPKSIAGRFRLYMSVGRAFHSQGYLRTSFYHKVKTRTKMLLNCSSELGMPLEGTMSTPERKFKLQREQDDKLTDSITMSLESSAQDLLGVVATATESEGTQAEHENVPGRPIVVIALDEAEIMGKYHWAEDGSYWSSFASFRRVFRMLRKLPFYSIFLSTTGHISQFSPPLAAEHSGRLSGGHLFTIPPYCAFGFDNLIRDDKFVADGTWTLGKVTAPSYWVKLGRPLWGARYANGSTEVKKQVIDFAMKRLLLLRDAGHANPLVLTPNQLLAVLAPRLALQFKSRPQPESSRQEDMEMQQVENHLRVCLSIDTAFTSMLTVAPSEPTVVEAAAKVMRTPGFVSCTALQTVLRSPNMSKGDRGELVVANILLQALDDYAFGTSATRVHYITPTIKFFETLLPDAAFKELMKSPPSCGATGDKRTFEEVFKNSRLYVTHFVKVLDRKMLTRKNLLRLMVRGAAVICADGQDGIDLLLAKLHLNDKMKVENISIVLIQSKNKQNIGRTPHVALFDAMDPYLLGIFPPEHELPVIRVVFALEAPTKKNAKN
ncbi:hypothetical protein OBBRIDRAFT_860305, partial [Obba rivulosa]